MNELTEDTKKSLLVLTDNLLLETSLMSNQLSLYKFVNYDKSITMELFSQNIQEYLYLMVSQSILTFFSTGLKNILVKLSELLVKSQEGEILSNPEPYDLKCKFKNGEEYWIEIKSVFEQNSSSKYLLKEHKEYADNSGKIFKLYLYEEQENNLSDEIYFMNGNDYWELIAGFKNAKHEIFKQINGAANKLSISSIIKETQNRLLNEWKMQS